MKIFHLAILSILTLTSQTFADDLSLDKSDWVSTGAGNSLEKAAGFFVFKSDIKTTSESTNIHSHNKVKEFSSLRNYTYSGQLKLTDPDGGGIGVTFHSRYPKADQYYRLRTTPGSDFHIAPHPDGIQNITSGDTDSGVIPTANEWHNFKINVRTTAEAVRIRAKVWRAGSKQPGWQIDCSDTSSIRIKSGKVGIWSMADGEKRWRKLSIGQ